MGSDVKYILYGAGLNGRRLLSLVGKEKVSCFCDNKWESIHEMDGVPVISPFSLKKRDDVSRNVIITSDNPRVCIEMALSLKDMGIDYLLIDDIIASIARAEAEKYNKLNTRSSLSFKEAHMRYFPYDRFMNNGGGWELFLAGFMGS